MERVGDDAGEPGGIEQPLFQVELPRPGLAREQGAAAAGWRAG